MKETQYNPAQKAGRQCFCKSSNRDRLGHKNKPNLITMAACTPLASFHRNKRRRERGGRRKNGIEEWGKERRKQRRRGRERPLIN